ncbi:MAG: DUF1294 domain-containing protein [Bacillaceae bacterium]|nr:DUF1294 domain-containing protein [Bacillaceae bacterium]
MSGFWVLYIIFSNMVTLVLMAADKYRAIHGKWRIRERTVWLWSLAGGSIGTLTGMYLFRHKTKHKTFTILMPLLVVLQGAGLILIKMMS